jgi:AcrR family transcriptional regulator
MDTNRTQRGEARSTILEAADRLFYQHGIRGVSIDSIAEQAGVTKRTIYYHFPTKRDLVKAYLKTRDEKTRQWFEHEAEKFGAVPTDHILGVFDLLGDWFAAPDYRGCPFLSSIVEMSDDPELVREAVVAHKEAVAGWLSDKLKEAGAREVTSLTEQLMLLVDGSLIRSLIFRNVQLAPQAKAAAEILLHQSGLVTNLKTNLKPRKINERTI